MQRFYLIIIQLGLGLKRLEQAARAELEFPLPKTYLHYMLRRNPIVDIQNLSKVTAVVYSLIVGRTGLHDRSCCRRYCESILQPCGEGYTTQDYARLNVQSLRIRSNSYYISA